MYLTGPLLGGSELTEVIDCGNPALNNRESPRHWILETVPGGRTGLRVGDWRDEETRLAKCMCCKDGPRQGSRGGVARAWVSGNGPSLHCSCRCPSNAMERRKSTKLQPLRHGFPFLVSSQLSAAHPHPQKEPHPHTCLPAAAAAATHPSSSTFANHHRVLHFSQSHLLELHR